MIILSTFEDIEETWAIQESDYLFDSDPESVFTRPQPFSSSSDCESDCSASDYRPSGASSTTPATASLETSAENAPLLQPISELVYMELTIQLSHFSATRLGSPEYWAASYQKITSLKPGSIIHFTLLDFFFISEWQKRSNQSNPAIYYVDKLLLNQILDKKIDQQDLKERLMLSFCSFIPQAPICLMIERDGGYFMVLFDFAKKKALISGRKNRFMHPVHAEWESWNGPLLWRNTCMAFGWEKDAENVPTVYEIDWAGVRIHIMQRDTSYNPDNN
jgi:hypothetical protein